MRPGLWPLWSREAVGNWEGVGGCQVAFCTAFGVVFPGNTGGPFLVFTLESEAWKEVDGIALWQEY